MSGALVFTAAAQRTPFDHLALVAGGWDGEAFIPGSHRTVVLGRMVFGRLPLPEHCTNSGLRHIHTPSLTLAFCEGSLLSWSFGLRGRLQIWHTFSGLWSGLWPGLSRNVCCSCHLCALPLPCSSSLVSLRKEHLPSPGAWISATVAQQTPPDRLALVASRSYACSPTGLHMYSYF